MNETRTCSIVALVLVALLLPSVASEPARASESYRFVVVADSREGRGGTVNSAALGDVFSEIAALDPAPGFVFFSGDLAWGYDTPARVEAGFEDWRATIEASGYPIEKVYPVFGGHERVGDTPAGTGGDLGMTWSAFEGYFDPVAQSATPRGESAMSCRYYDAAANPPGDSTDFAHTVYYCDFGRDRFFVLNNDCIPAAHSTAGRVGDAWGCVGHELGCGQLNWIRRHLEGSGKRHNFFFQHEPAFGTGAHQPSCPNTLERVMDNQKAQRNDYVRLLGHHNATAIFSGHEHQYTRRYIESGLLDRGLNSDRVKTSLAVLIEAAPLGQAAGPATAHSFDGSPRHAPVLKLWWTKKRGKPDWKGAIRAGRDDAETLVDQGVYLDSSDLELMRDGDRGEQRWIALRWTNVPIPKKAKIKKARISFTAKTSSADGPTVRIRAEAAAFALPFSHCAGDIGLRPTTRRAKVWRVGPWQAGKTYLTPNLAKVFKQLVGRHRSGERFPGGFQEIKTGSCGAPWNSGFCSQFMGNVLARVITEGDYTGEGVPYHYAVVDVNGERVDYSAYSWDGTLLDTTR